VTGRPRDTSRGGAAASTPATIAATPRGYAARLRDDGRASQPLRSAAPPPDLIRPPRQLPSPRPVSTNSHSRWTGKRGPVILVTGTDTGSFQVFFDSTGTPVRLQIETVSTNTFSANGITIPFRSANKNTFNLINGTGTDIGLDIRVTIPGVGNLYLDRGRLVFDSNGNLIFEAGPHPSLHGDIDGLCAALTP
jgi:hypothetical protein